MSKWNYFNTVDVDGYHFPSNPQVDFKFMAQGIALLNRGGRVAQYSFDGSTVHGDLNPSDPSAGIIFDARFESKIWFKADDGFTVVRVEAWG